MIASISARTSFLLGVLLYEMLTGTWPFRGKTTIDVRHAVLHDPPRPIAELRCSADSASLQQIIDQRAREGTEDRFQNMEDFRNELRQVLQEVDPGAADIRTLRRNRRDISRRQIPFRARFAG